MSIRFLNLMKKTRINVDVIFQEYYSSLKNSSGVLSKLDKRVFFIYPVFCALVLSLLGRLSKDYIEYVVTVMAIISGLLLNMLVLLISEAKKIPDNHVDKPNRKLLVKDTFSVISYTVLMALILIAISSLIYFINLSGWNFDFYIKRTHVHFDILEYAVIVWILRTFASIIILSLAIHILFNVVLIVRRIHTFFKYEIDC